MTTTETETVETTETDEGKGTETTTDTGKEGEGDKGKENTWTPPTEAEWRATQEKLKKANGQAAAHRKEADELKRKGETEAEANARKAREEADANASKTWKPRIVRQAARAALVEAGLTGAPDRLLKLVDVDQVEVDDEGEVTGLDEQIKGLKKDYPELFAKRGAGRIDAADKGGDGGGKQTGWSATSRKLLEQAS